MTTSNDTNTNMALFCDFENVALGVREVKFPKFEIALVLERLLVKGSIVAKKAYCDWDRYKEFKATMHDAAFEMIEIPHTRQSGKNSADIHMVVDALDLCYTKEHIDTFVIISGDSDFSPLVSKLRENNKTVIGVGVKNSTSDLLMNNCDEFIFYDDLVRASDRPKPRRRGSKKPVNAPKTAQASDAGKNEADDKGAGSVDEAIDLVMETAEALSAERGEPIWGSMVKQTLKRRRPGFNESYYGFRAFSDLLEEAEDRGLVDLEMDERSGGYLLRMGDGGG
ncbi:MAG: NYN domain-containing protein [Alphaproteobacteria bacterium]|nr:NYN domain-containing protein [Alphaproteobacteria bacterium]